MDKLTIGVWQGVCADGDLAANLDKTAWIIDRAAEAGCDFLCVPEQFLSGYGCAEFARNASMTLDDPRLLELAAHAADRGVVTLAGMIEKRGDLYANTQVVLDGGEVVGHYTKTMQVGGDKELMGFFDDDLPVFHAKGVCFGIIVCHDSSFPEVAATMAWKGARIIFSPHYNSIHRDRMDDHRIMVRNNHVGIAAHYNVVVARSNVVGHWKGDRFGYGDSAIFAPNGVPIAEAGLFAEKLITADVAPFLDTAKWRNRKELRPPIIQQLHDAAMAALNGEGGGS